MDIKIIIDKDEIHYVNLNSIKLKGERLLLKGIDCSLIIAKNNMIFEEKNAIPMIVDYIEIGGISYSKEDYEKISKILI
ncbi:hypothetical protein [Fusobacterium sp. SYSU M8D902]|uniref:hypothetical protein n=1 Tax=Fusobacterium sp. SYSU M8D902 TaxID=3159562 RepID=UPI0032E4D8A7